LSKSWIYSWKAEEWQAKTIDLQFAREHLRYAASCQFLARRVQPGDTIFVVNIALGRVYLGGYVKVLKIVDRENAETILGVDGTSLWKASDYAIADTNELCDFRPKLLLSNDLIDTLWLVEPNRGQVNPKRAANGGVDPQTFRAIRQLVAGEERKLFESLGC